MTRVLDAAISASWAITEEGAQTLVEIAARENTVTPEALSAYRAKSLERAERATVRDGVAILEVTGPLFKRANLMTEMSGATSYDVLRRDLQTALDNANVRAIMFNIDSPGGEAHGVSELAGAIMAARGKKPIVAFAADMAASAAYWIATAADKIIIGPGASVGSIGVRAALIDGSKAEERSGYKRVEFVSSQSPYKKTDLTTEEGRNRIQARVDALAEVFVEAVAANRGVELQKVLADFGKGDVLLGRAAVAAGMADEIGDFESTLASLARETDPLTRFVSGTQASSAQPHEEIMTEKTGAEDAPKVETEPKAPAADTTPTAPAADVATAVQAALDAERDRVAGIMDATLEGYETMRDEAIKSGSPVSAFHALIVANEKAKAADKAKAVTEDLKKTEGVKPSNASQDLSEVDAAVKAIFAARNKALGN